MLTSFQSCFDWSNEWTWFEIAWEVPREADENTVFHSNIFLWWWIIVVNNDPFHYPKNLQRIIAINAFCVASSTEFIKNQISIEEKLSPSDLNIFWIWSSQNEFYHIRYSYGNGAECISINWCRRKQGFFFKIDHFHYIFFVLVGIYWDSMNLLLIWALL